MDLFSGVHQAVKFMLEQRGARARSVSLHGTSVHYFDAEGTGKGAPVVLVHGLGGSANNFFRIFHSLRRRFSRVLALDFPGNGFSPVPLHGPFRFRDQLGLLQSFQERVVGTPSFVVGNSLGGALALSLAVEAPDQVRALGLIAPAGAAFSEQRMKELLACLVVSDDEGARALVRRLFHRPTLLPYLFGPEIRRLYNQPAVKVLCEEAPSLPALDPVALRGIASPVLLLWGASEKLLPYESIEYFRQHLPPHSHIEEVKGFGHIPMLERPGSVVRKLVDFADAHAL